MTLHCPAFNFSTFFGHFVESRKIFLPQVFNARAEGVFLEFCNGVERKKLGWCLCHMIEKLCDMCIRLDTISECDGQTDRQTEMVKQYRALHAMQADSDKIDDRKYWPVDYQPLKYLTNLINILLILEVIWVKNSVFTGQSSWIFKL